MPLIMECNRVGSSFGSYQYGYGYPGNYHRQYSRSQAPNRGDVEYDSYGNINPHHSIPMNAASPFWNGKPLKTSLPIAAYSDLDHASIPIRQLINNPSSSVWLRIFGDATISELFFLCSGDNISYLENNRTRIAAKLDQTSVSRITRDLTSAIITPQLQGSDPEGLQNFIYDRIYPHI